MSNLTYLPTERDKVEKRLAEAGVARQKYEAAVRAADANPSADAYRAAADAAISYAALQDGTITAMWHALGFGLRQVK